MRSDELPLEIEEGLVGEQLAGAIAGHADAAAPESSDADQLIHVFNFSLGLEALLREEGATSKSCFSRRARSSSRLTMMSTSSWKKEHLR